ncbi:MAG: gamma-glutamylcyclotransferase family protein [Actinomycetota bacterium]
MAPDPAALAVYGTLAPGEMNAEVMADIDGLWRAGTVRGHRSIWPDGPYRGLPRLVLDAEGPAVPVQVLHAVDLPDHWDRLDEFEGVAYRRVLTVVHYDEADDVTGRAEMTATVWVYEADLEYDFGRVDLGERPYHGSPLPE